MSTAPPVTVTVKRRFASPPERVFDAWLDPKLVAEWMFGPSVRDEEVLRIAIDPRVGGLFSFLVRRGGQEIDHVGEYLEIDRPRRLAFTWAVGKRSPDDTHVILDFAAAGAGCELTLRHERVWADYQERTQQGWTAMLEAVARLLASGG
jgi:uncharacterized protein YndB with AHSA1/START domain